LLGLVDHYLGRARLDGALETAEADADRNQHRAAPLELHDRELSSGARWANPDHVGEWSTVAS
jgi:hypothetical protein